jgi:hypothetical protein
MACVHFMVGFLHVMQGLLTPTIGGIAVYIAYQQWKTNERGAVLARYERRLRIYQRVVEELRRICGDFKPTIPDLIKFSAETSEADFLFGPEIPAYINEIFTHAMDLNTARAEYRDFLQPPPPPSYDHQKIVEELMRQEKWMVEQVQTVAKEKFRKYLNVG